MDEVRKEAGNTPVTGSGRSGCLAFQLPVRNSPASSTVTFKGLFSCFILVWLVSFKVGRQRFKSSGGVA